MLGSWPTPLEPAPRLAAAAGLAADALWVKRDDLSGLGGGGNKVRKLQYTCAQAEAQVRLLVRFLVRAGTGGWRDDGDYQRRAAK